LSARKITFAALGTAALLAAVPASASAQAPSRAPTVTTISSKVVAPFNLAIHGHRLLVADGGTSTLSRVLANGSLKTIAKGPGHGGEVAGAAISRDGRYTAYTTTEHTSPEVNANGTLHIIGPHGWKRSVNVGRYEARHNPDKKTTYGTNSNDPCVIKAIEKVTHGPAKYSGQKDSHPFSVTAWGKHSWVVADAAGNDLLKVDARGRISTLAVLPAQPLTITSAVAKGLGLPSCTVGTVYRFEPVPTDVEVGRHGRLYVTTLPGGPETGARGSVYRVNPWNGHSHRVATGFAGATNLALYRGKIYVAEFYAGRVSTVSKGHPKLYKTLPGVVSVESGNWRLYAGTFASAKTPGKIVRLAGHRHH
jgi:hypothetical protein